MSKVLVADDSIAVRKVAERLLTEAGLGVVLAANGEEALAYLAKDRADVIVSDVIMPDKSGYEICAYVRGHSLLASTPVLLMSGIVNDEVLKQAESCRADGVLKKPFQDTSLKDKVLDLLAKGHSPAAACIPEPASPMLPQVVPGQSEGLTAQPVLSPAQTPTPEPPTIQNSGILGSVASPVTEREEAQLANKIEEIEKQLQAEQARTESLTKRILDLEEELSRAKESEVLVEAERRRLVELEAKLADREELLARIAELEAAFKEEQEAAARARDEAAASRVASQSIAQLEAALDEERTAAAQLVQQITELEMAAARGKDAEAMLAQEISRIAELERKAGESETLLLASRMKVAELEAALASARLKAVELEQRISEAGALEAKVQELDSLLATERDRNAVMVRRVAEAEQAAVNAAKRFEEIVRKLGEIASLASQLGKETEEPLFR